MNEKVNELIKLYESILHGSNGRLGLFDCCDSYYNGCWDDQLRKVQELKKELNHPDNDEPTGH